MRGLGPASVCGRSCCDYFTKRNVCLWILGKILRQMSCLRKVGTGVSEKERNVRGNYKIIWYGCMTIFNKDKMNKC